MMSDSQAGPRKVACSAVTRTGAPFNSRFSSEAVYMDERTRPSWERQEGETLRAFACFEIYRNMLPVERSLVKVRQQFGRKTGYLRQLEKWSSKYAWVRRSQDFDAYTNSVRLAARSQAIEEMADRQARQGVILQDAGFRVFLDADGNLKPLIGDTLSPHVAIRAIEVGAKLERLGRGEPMDILKIPRKAPEDYSDEELDALIVEIKRIHGL